MLCDFHLKFKKNYMRWFYVCMCVRIYVYMCVCIHDLFIVALGNSSKSKDKKEHIGTSLVAQWLRLQAASAGMQQLKRSHTEQQRPDVAK